MKNDFNRVPSEYDTPVDHRKMMEHLEEFTRRYGFISVSFMGSSLLGRPIPLVKLGNEQAAGAVLYVGTHHAMEWITTVVLLRFIEEYCEMKKRGASVYGLNMDSLYDSRLIYIVPMLNPDGVDLQINGIGPKNPMAERLLRMNGSETDFRKWQANARGVDLNHNYNAGFGDYKKIEMKSGITGGAPTRFSGEFPESEPEVGCLCNFIRFNSSIKAALTFHTQGEEIYTGSVTGDGAGAARALGKTVEKLTGYKLSEPEGMACYGGMTDWMTKELKKPSFTVECGKGTNPLPLSDNFEIYTRIRELLFTFPVLV